MNYLKIISAIPIILFFNLLFYLSASAYTYPYDQATGFAVLYTIVAKDELSEPEYAVGEIHPYSSMCIQLLLPNENTLTADLPYFKEYVTNAEMQYFFAYPYCNSSSKVIRLDPYTLKQTYHYPENGIYPLQHITK